MPSRRSLLATAVGVVGAGCSSSGESDIDPADHVPDSWHEEPERGLAAPLTMNARDLSQHPQSDCPSLAAKSAAKALEDRLGNPENVSGGELSQVVDSHDSAILWVRTVRVSQNGEVISSPNVEFQTLREAAPQTVKAPDDSDHDCQIPVFVMDRMSQPF